ncbi:MAG: antitoxin VapB family protein [Nanoarchaeota archaeon]|nr:antitoxin VapB family protein [Nanoarchaeota archaeon]
MVTTIQISEDAKKRLEKMKSNKETYEDVIVKLIDIVDNNKTRRDELLKEEAIEMAEENLRITKEWEPTDFSLDWEWDDN